MWPMILAAIATLNRYCKATSPARLWPRPEGGARVAITKDGKPVAVLAPAEAPGAAGRAQARQRMLALLREGLPLGFSGGVDRDALHTR